MTFDTNKQGLKVVGTRPIRPDGVEKVTGRANFGADRALPGMLYGKIKRSPTPMLGSSGSTPKRRWRCRAFGRLRRRPTSRRSCRKRRLSAKAR